MILYDLVKLVLIIPVSYILMKDSLWNLKVCGYKQNIRVTIRGGLFCCIKLANLGEGGIDFLDISELIGWHGYFQILTT